MLTLGGLPESQARHWEHATYQELGGAILLMLSSSPEKRRKGYIQFHELRRFFMPVEWGEYLGRLDAFRSMHDARRIDDIVKEISCDMGDHAKPAPLPETEPGPVVISDTQEPVQLQHKKKTGQRSSETCEQLSLF